MTFKQSNYITGELNIEIDQYIYQHTSLLVELLPHLEKRENFEACAEIMRILKLREKINL
jgi:hypothetical protein